MLNGCKSRVSPNSGNYIAKGKVKAQKLQKQHALKGQKLLAQGSALGIMAKNKDALKGQKLCILPGILKLLPLQGDKFASVITQGDALG